MRARSIGAVDATQTSAAYAAGVQEGNYSSGSVRLMESYYRRHRLERQRRGPPTGTRFEVGTSGAL